MLVEPSDAIVPLQLPPLELPILVRLTTAYAPKFSSCKWTRRHAVLPGTLTMPTRLRGDRERQTTTALQQSLTAVESWRRHGCQCAIRTSPSRCRCWTATSCSRRWIWRHRNCRCAKPWMKPVLSDQAVFRCIACAARGLHAPASLPINACHPSSHGIA